MPHFCISRDKHPSTIESNGEGDANDQISSKRRSTAHEPTHYPFTYTNRRPLLELVVALDKLSAAQEREHWAGFSEVGFIGLASTASRRARL